MATAKISTISLASPDAGKETPQRPLNERVKELEDAFVVVKKEIETLCHENTNQIIAVGFFGLGLFAFCALFGKALYDYKGYEATWTWQMIYFTATRLVIASATFYAATYLLSLLKSYLHIYQTNRHKLLVINSMASLVHAGIDELTRDKIYHKLLDIIVNLNETGLLKKDKEEKIDSSLIDSMANLFQVVKQSV